MKFKKGDIVKCVNVENACSRDVDRLQLGELYIVFEQRVADNVLIYKYFGKFKYESKSLGGFYPKRFKKVSKKYLTEKQKFEYIKYKLGVRDECQKKQV